MTGERVAAELIRQFALKLRQNREHLTSLDGQIETTPECRRVATVIGGVAGLRTTLTSEFIAEAAILARFLTRGNLASSADRRPVLKESGEVRYRQRARGGNKTVRRVLYQSAFCFLTHPTSRVL